MLAPLLATIALAGTTHAADLNALFADALPQAKAKTRIAVLLPDALPTDAKRLYADHWETRRTYTLSLGAVPDCGEATACFEAEFRGQKGGAPFGKRRVALARGRHGRFQPLSCGASCSPPSISWSERGATYTIQANVVSRGSDRAALTKMANEAIRRGPR
jgi:rRNA maturation protein Nop10